MRKALIFVLVAIMTISVCSIAFASEQVTSKSGTTAGGSSTTTCTGEMHYNLVGTGEDYVYAETASDLVTGNIGATAKIYYNSTSTSKTKTAFSSQVATGKATVGSGYRATSAKTSHSFNSSTYGSWSATITKGF